MKVIPYNRESAVDYANRWALGRNPAYYDFEKIGGDCTNFASQCIYAGAKVMNYTADTGWFYRSPTDRAAAWTGVGYLYKFLINNKSVGPFGRAVSINEVKIGDIVQLGDFSGKFYHTPVITTTYPQILVSAHSYDAINKPLSSYVYEHHRFVHIEGVRIW